MSAARESIIEITPALAVKLLSIWRGTPAGANPQPVAKHVDALKAGTVLDGTITFVNGMLYTGLHKLVSIRERGIAGRIRFVHDDSLTDFLT
jgi:hypothetical protein